MGDNEWAWRCIVCEKEIEIDHPGEDSRATWPNVVGGTIEIDFGYGSRFDDMNFPSPRVTHQTCICDDCYESRKHLTRPVVKKSRHWWQVLSPDYDKWAPGLPHPSLDEIKSQLSEIVRPDCVNEWMETPNPSLGDRKPIDVARTSPIELLHLMYYLRTGGPS